ncbi:MAG: aspartate ammonia-lyase, partial [Erysipelotrichaceae bacterium]|nr:aspartate ammonia-lyase [Erysipelotrichaceae bacterium]
MDYRIEVDSLGEVQVPIDALYGAQTTRAISNFTITRLTTHPKMIQAIGMVKKAAAIANFECGYLDQERLGYIIQACDEVISGVHDNSFITDVIQGGAGTSVNMCANEVIANRAAQLANQPLGV